MFLFQYPHVRGRVQCCCFVSASAYRTCHLHIFIFIYEIKMNSSRPRLSLRSRSPGYSCVEPPSRKNLWKDMWTTGWICSVGIDEIHLSIVPSNVADVCERHRLFLCLRVRLEPNSNLLLWLKTFGRPWISLWTTAASLASFWLHAGYLYFLWPWMTRKNNQAIMGSEPPK